MVQKWIQWRLLVSHDALNPVSLTLTLSNLKSACRFLVLKKSASDSGSVSEFQEETSG